MTILLFSFVAEGSWKLRTRGSVLSRFRSLSTSYREGARAVTAQNTCTGSTKTSSRATTTSTVLGKASGVNAEDPGETVTRGTNESTIMTNRRTRSPATYKLFQGILDLEERTRFKSGVVSFSEFVL